jgi:hypothetical protein
MKLFHCVLAAVALFFLTPFAHAVTLGQIISRENPLYSNRDAQLTVGRDGLVYLHSHVAYNGYVTRLTPDGQDKTGFDTGPATGNVAANADGVLAAANQHFTHAVGLYDKNGTRLTQVSDFVSWTKEFGEPSGYNDPARVEAGASGDFYALDQFRDAIVRIAPDGKVLRKYSVPRDGDGINGLAWDFRVAEKAALFYLRSRDTHSVRAVGFDGKQQWKANFDTSGGWDVDDDGVLYAISARSDTVQKFGTGGQAAGSVTLTGQITGEGDFKSALTPYPIISLRVWNNEIFIKRAHPTEMFLRFDQNSGVLKQAIASSYEKLTVTYPREVWTAGERLDFSIAHDDPIHHAKPQWRVWARGLSTPDYEEWKIENGKLLVPQGAAGIYQIKVTPEVQPWQRGAASEYLVRSWIEVRAPNSKGTANVFTADNRAYFARGEKIPFSVLLRGGKALEGKSLPVSIQLREIASAQPASAGFELQPAALAAGAGRILAETKTTAKIGTGVTLELAPSLTNALAPGRYKLIASTPDLTSVAQPLVIGNAPQSDFFTVQYGDYQQPGFFPNYPKADIWTATDLSAAHVARTNKLGVNLVVERLGHNVGEVTDSRLKSQIETLRARLAADPLAVAPDKVLLANPLLQAMAERGANGIAQMPLLLYMDAALPIGSAPQADGRKFPKLKEDITTVTNALKNYPSFRGWSWVANWWIWNAEARYANAAEKAAYQAALKTAKETGAWSGVLDTVGDRRFSFGIEAEKNFHDVLSQLAPGKASALSGPYRAVDSYPPLSFANADEVDLHYQAEQIQWPFVPWHDVDYQKRSGKAAWGHPEVWNDSGTGEQIWNSLFGMVMRGADGVGTSGKIPNWGEQSEDARSSYFGTPSAFRAVFWLFHDYGPWLGTLKNNDRVAIVVSGRMAKIDDWKGIGGEYFTRLYEAYQSCLYAHRPASFVFAEDLKPGTLQKYGAVLLVGQTVEMEPALATALTSVKSKVFTDGTCRASLVKEYAPLGVSFDQVTHDPSTWQDDSAYPRFAAYFMANAAALQKVLSKVQPPAQVREPQVLLTERAAENGRYLWVLNNTLSDVAIGKLWRFGKFIAARAPLVTTIKLNAPQSAVYDVFAQEKVAPRDGTLTADLRTLPARLYAILPAAIARVALRGPATLQPGQTFKWWLQVRDARDKPIAASVPVRLRLLSGSAVIEERVFASGSKGIGGTMTLPLNASTPVLEATELFSGKTARLVMNTTLTPSPSPAKRAEGSTQSVTRVESTPSLSRGAGEGGLGRVRVVPLDKAFSLPQAAANTSGQTHAAQLTPAENAFGPHARDLVVSQDDTTALINAMNWDDNLYALDVKTGKLKWRSRIGDWFAFAPQSLPRGFAVQGFDGDSPNGYHLYLADEDGHFARRFALPGLPKGATNWAMAALLLDRINNFRAAPDGSWIAGAGDLGVAVWSRDGQVLWSQNWRDHRHTATLTALGARTLVLGEGMTATAYDATTGKPQWKIKLADNGEIRGGAASRDGSTLALATTADNGRVFVIRDGKVATDFLNAAEEIALTRDGSTLALTTGNLLKIYDTSGGLAWSFGGDDTLHFPRFAQDDKRLAVSSELGTTTVLSSDGKVLWERDQAALAAPAWLRGGDLLLADWDGNVARYDSVYHRVWSTRLQASDIEKTASGVPTSRAANWSNAETQPAPLIPNLLKETNALFSVQLSDKPIALQNDAALLTDGKPDAPPQPWVSWTDIGMIDSGWRGALSIVFDTFRTQLRVTGITLVEDLQHPESWLRDANLEYWDAAKSQWIFAASLLSDSAVHTHTFAQPIEAAKFRLVKSSTPGTWPVGNIRLGEVVFHGTALGASHPDVIAKKPRAVLFDEGDDLKAAMVNLDFKLDDAFSGGRSLKVEAGKPAGANWTPPFGHALPNWNFPIRENPQPGEYRWLQFAWKALSPQTSSIALLIGKPWPGGGVNITAGNYNWGQGVLAEKKIAGAPPQQWQTVRVDLWDALKKPIDLQSLSLASEGGAAAFDQIVLGRSEADLPPLK